VCLQTCWGDSSDGDEIYKITVAVLNTHEDDMPQSCNDENFNENRGKKIDTYGNSPILYLSTYDIILSKHHIFCISYLVDNIELSPKIMSYVVDHYNLPCVFL